jgi:SecD/SecF fusion protein
MKPSRWILLLALLVIAIVSVTGVAWFFFLRSLHPSFERDGGTVLVFEIDETQPPIAFEPASLVAAVKRRVDPYDLKRITVRAVGEKQVEISIPRWRGHETLVQEVKDLVAQAGKLEFRILANPADDADAMDSARISFQEAKNDARASAELVRRNEAGLPPPRPPAANEAGFLTEKGRFTYSWLELSRACQADHGFDNAAEKESEPDGTPTERARQWQEAAAARTRNEPFQQGNGPLFYSRDTAAKRRQGDDADKRYEYFVLVRDIAAGTKNPGEYVDHAAVGMNLTVVFSLRPPGDDLMRDLSGANVDRPLALVLDGQVMSWANVHSKIGSDGEITGHFTRDQVERLAMILRAGAFPANLKPLPVSEVQVDPKKGK